MPAVLVVEPRGGRVGWALVAANGRPLARSVPTYRTGADLANAVRELLADRRSLRVWIGRDEGALTWSWTASLPARGGQGSGAGPGGGSAGPGPEPGGASGTRKPAGAAAGATTRATTRAVARSARGYLRHDQCRTGAAGFMEALDGLTPPPPGLVPGRVVAAVRRTAGPGTE